MAQAKPTVAVIGAGVIGLTSAMRLGEAGFAVTLFAQRLPPHTTSDVAAAFWAPSATADGARSKTWALTSLATFQRFATNPATGVLFMDLYSLADVPTAMAYMATAGAMREVPPGIFPAPWSGWCATVPRIDVPVYMPWLLGQVVAMGVTIQPKLVQNFAEIDQSYQLLVNCSGLGASALTGDAMYPVRGQVMSVRKPAGLTPAIIYANDDHTTTYIIPRGHDCLLGGTYQFYDGNPAVDMAVAEQILARCAVFNPALRRPEILQHNVGLRPGRHAVRLEQESLPSGQVVIHNYGHGSVGHTLSWGCAAEVVTLARAAVGL
ncbi:MAG: FAD-dependent oxidoreductase [Caldilineaceae bacterium]|nr:FAD-dependent oxidoreductase [Caldilineaceae bacterium]